MAILAYFRVDHSGSDPFNYALEQKDINHLVGCIITKMRIVYFIVASLAAGLAPQCGFCCDYPVVCLESVIGRIFNSTGDNPTTIRVGIIDLNPVCRAHGQDGERFREVSVTVQYTCNGSAECPSTNMTGQTECVCNGEWYNDTYFIRTDVSEIHAECPVINPSSTSAKTCKSDAIMEPTLATTGTPELYTDLE